MNDKILFPSEEEPKMEARFHLHQTVTIEAVECPARVTAICFRSLVDPPRYEVVYWMDGKRNQDWFDECELKGGQP